MGNGMGPVPATVVDEGLGNTCYLLDLGDGGALVVDPPRDLRSVRAAAEKAGLRIRFVADTHLHADFLSGAVQLAHDDGAQVLASAAGHREFEHRGLVDGDEVDLGGLVLLRWPRPGTPTSTCRSCCPTATRRSGCSPADRLIVGSAARTDLLGRRPGRGARPRPVPLAAAGSPTLPDETAVWPTHGAGSFCSAPPGADRTSTIGRELATNPLLRHPTATRSSQRCSARSAATRRTSCGSPRSTGAARRFSTPVKPGGLQRCRSRRCSACAPTAPS